jgi:hypothetical protein
MVLERMKGRKVVRLVSSPRDRFSAHLIGYSTSGYQIQIFCEKKMFQKEYSRWYIRSKNHDIYRVYAVVSPDAPETLRKACELDISFPPLYPEFFSDSFQKDAAVEAYLDSLISVLDPQDRFNA